MGRSYTVTRLELSGTVGTLSPTFQTVPQNVLDGQAGAHPTTPVPTGSRLPPGLALMMQEPVQHEDQHKLEEQ